MAVLGKVAMTPKGEWSDATAYEKLDLVTKTESTQASLYIATENITAGTVLSNKKWMKLYTVKNGTNGTNGTPGAKGTDGKYITAISLTKDESGGITGGTATMSDETTISISVS